ncbi:MAG: magnesium transporter [Desulfotomaculales bacterium]
MALEHELRRAIEEGADGRLKELIQDLHPADLARVFPSLKLAQQVKILRLMDPERAAQVLVELGREQVPPLVEGLGPLRIADILATLPTDDAADLLGDLPAEQKDGLLGLMAAADAKEVRELLEYPQDTAGGIMTTEFVAISERLTAEEAIRVLRETAPDAETVYYVYVVNEQGQLVGVLSLRELILAAPGMPVGDIMRRRVISVHVMADQEEVARVVAKYDLLAVPVVDDNQELLGIVTVDDVLDVIKEEAAEDFLRISAIDIRGDDVTAPPWRRAMHRLPWLVAFLLGEMMAATVIKGFAGTLEAATVLAFFITAIAGGAGNAGTQSLAVVVRGLATGELNAREILRVVWRETRVGLLVGLGSGLTLAFVALVWQGWPLLGLVVGGALAASILVATMLGSMIPVVMARLGFDPALASGPFITTLTDVASMLVYFSLATLTILHLR